MIIFDLTKSLQALEYLVDSGDTEIGLERSIYGKWPTIHQTDYQLIKKGTLADSLRFFSSVETCVIEACETAFFIA